jgi:GNAT superfamily N-acetyltransferase
MWADYIKETFGKEMLQTEYGFATFYIVPETTVCYIEDIYVIPELRKSKIGSELEAEITIWAKERKCTELMGSVNLTITTPERSMAVLISRGYKLTSATPTMLYFRKQLDY